MEVPCILDAHTLSFAASRCRQTLIPSINHTCPRDIFRGESSMCSTVLGETALSSSSSAPATLVGRSVRSSVWSSVWSAGGPLLLFSRIDLRPMVTTCVERDWTRPEKSRWKM